MAVRCQQNLLFSSRTCRDFESNFPCFDSDLPCLESDIPIFRVNPSHFSSHSFLLSQVRPSSQTFPFFRVSPFQFSKSVILIFRLTPSYFYGSVLTVFQVSASHSSSQTFPFFGSLLLTFRVRPPSHFLHYVLPDFACSVLRFDRHVHCLQNWRCRCVQEAFILHRKYSCQRN